MTMTTPNPVTRLASVLHARHTPDADELAILAAESLAASLWEAHGYSATAEYLQAAADLHRDRMGAGR